MGKIWYDLRAMLFQKKQPRRSHQILSVNLLMKVNQRNFEDAPHGSAIFEDIKMTKRKNIRLSRTGARFLSTQNLEF